ncbi:MAG: TetR/AcrR family transcriptional regulator [Clostridiales Family XIII bacterium]|nr:TetR/AcrR family transcriptional regulator [Clostridiales Family XIII bacterium]
MKKKNTTSRSLQAKKTKSRIFHCATKLIDQYGYDNVTIEEISKKANVSIGAFYHYYESKSAIFSELYMKIDEYFKNEVASLLVEEDIADNILLFFRHYARYNVERGYKHVRLLFETQNKLFVDKQRFLYVLFKRMLVDGRQSGQLSADYEIEYIEDYLLVLARGVVYDWILKEGEFDLEERMTEYIGVLGRIFRTDQKIRINAEFR